MHSNVLPLKSLKQTFPPMIWICTEGRGDGIKSRWPFKIFFSLKILIHCNILVCFQVWYESIRSEKIIWKFSFRFADSYNMPLFETSAKNDDKCDHVEAIFLTLAHKINANKLLFKTREELESTSTVQVTSNASVEEESGYCCFWIIWLW